MPIYEYQCEECGHIFEEITFQMTTKKNSTECPSCKKIAKKIPSCPGVATIHGYNASNGYSGHMR